MLLVYLAALLALFPPNMATAQDTEEAAIRAAVEGLYVRGLAERDFSLITEICVRETVLMSADAEGLIHVTTLSEWEPRFDPANPPFKSLDAKIARVDIQGTAAQVRVDFVLNGDRPVTDFLNLLKIGGKWRIVNVIDY